jgi:hypothetical protein
MCKFEIKMRLATFWAIFSQTHRVTLRLDAKPKSDRQKM